MLKITNFQREEGSSHLYMIDDTGQQALLPLRDGFLEAYMEAYGLLPGQALELILLDYHDDSVSIPPYLMPGMRDIVDDILTKTDQLVWEIDRNETLAQITVAADTAPELSQTWRENRLRDESIFAGYERRQEELLADEIMGTYKEPLPSYQLVNGKLQRV